VVVPRRDQKVLTSYGDRGWDVAAAFDEDRIIFRKPALPELQDEEPVIEEE
jgi:hypothetical protein